MLHIESIDTRLSWLYDGSYLARAMKYIGSRTPRDGGLVVFAQKKKDFSTPLLYLSSSPQLETARYVVEDATVDVFHLLEQ